MVDLVSAGGAAIVDLAGALIGADSAEDAAQQAANEQRRQFNVALGLQLPSI